ncbi:MAG TPA: PIN domain-containing protein [Fibrobacteria bacterium]|nr:PIN domain-containing protein [Fibrobacteria bacterium]
MKDADLKRILAHSRKVGLDTSVLVYHFEGNSRYRPLTSHIFSAIAGGLEAILSPVGVIELLVQPFRSGNVKVTEAIIGQLRNMPNFTYLAMGFEVAVEAARIRAKFGLKTPDATHLATSLLGEADAFISNDEDFKKITGKEKIKILHLEDYLG